MIRATGSPAFGLSRPSSFSRRSSSRIARVVALNAAQSSRLSVPRDPVLRLRHVHGLTSRSPRRARRLELATSIRPGSGSRTNSYARRPASDADTARVRSVRTPSALISRTSSPRQRPARMASALTSHRLNQGHPVPYTACKTRCKQRPARNEREPAATTSTTDDRSSSRGVDSAPATAQARDAGRIPVMCYARLLRACYGHVSRAPTP